MGKPTKAERIPLLVGDGGFATASDVDATQRDDGISATTTTTTTSRGREGSRVGEAAWGIARWVAVVGTAVALYSVATSPSMNPRHLAATATEMLRHPQSLTQSPSPHGAQHPHPHQHQHSSANIEPQQQHQSKRGAAKKTSSKGGSLGMEKKKKVEDGEELFDAGFWRGVARDATATAREARATATAAGGGGSGGHGRGGRGDKRKEAAALGRTDKWAGFASALNGGDRQAAGGGGGGVEEQNASGGAADDAGYPAAAPRVRAQRGRLGSDADIGELGSDPASDAAAAAVAAAASANSVVAAAAHISTDAVPEAGEENHNQVWVPPPPYDSTHVYESFDPTIPDGDDGADREGASTTWDTARERGWVMKPETFVAAVAAAPAEYVVLHVVDGLGNRMRAVAAGKSLARDKKRKLVIVWERDATLDARVDGLLTPSFLRGAFLLEQLPPNFLKEGSKTAGYFSLAFDATTEEGKAGVAGQLDDGQYANWARAVYLKSDHAELRKTTEEMMFIEAYTVHFQPSPRVVALMKTVSDAHLAGKTDDEVVSMHIRGGEDSDLSSDLQLSDQSRTETAMVDSFRKQCSVQSFAAGLRQFVPQAITNDASVFVAADDPADVDALRKLLPRNQVYALQRPTYCNYGYNKARGEECMVYAVADLFLLARNPGPMLRSKFSSFSEFANFYRKRMGRVSGSGFVANGCFDQCGGGDDNKLSQELSHSQQRHIAAVRLLPLASARAFATTATSKANVLAFASAMNVETTAAAAAEERKAEAAGAMGAEAAAEATASASATAQDFALKAQAAALAATASAAAAADATAASTESHDAAAASSSSLGAMSSQDVASLAAAGGDSLLDADSIRGLAVCATTDEAQKAVEDVLIEMVRETRVNPTVAVGGYPSVPFSLDTVEDIARGAAAAEGAAATSLSPRHVEGSDFMLARVILCKSIKVIVDDGTPGAAAGRCFDGRIRYDVRLDISPNAAGAVNGGLTLDAHKIRSTLLWAARKSIRGEYVSLGESRQAFTPADTESAMEAERRRIITNAGGALINAQARLGAAAPNNAARNLGRGGSAFASSAVAAAAADALPRANDDASSTAALAVAKAAAALPASQINKKVRSSRVRARFTMGVDGGGHHRMVVDPLPLMTDRYHHQHKRDDDDDNDDSGSLGHAGINLCDAMYSAGGGLGAGGDAKDANAWARVGLAVPQTQEVAAREFLRTSDPEAAAAADHLCAPTSSSCSWFARCALAGTDEDGVNPGVDPAQAVDEVPATTKTVKLAKKSALSAIEEAKKKEQAFEDAMSDVKKERKEEKGTLLAHAMSEQAKKRQEKRQAERREEREREEAKKAEEEKKAKEAAEAAAKKKAEEMSKEKLEILHQNQRKNAAQRKNDRAQARATARAAAGAASGAASGAAAAAAVGKSVKTAKLGDGPSDVAAAVLSQKDYEDAQEEAYDEYQEQHYRDEYVDQPEKSERDAGSYVNDYEFIATDGRAEHPLVSPTDAATVRRHNDIIAAAARESADVLAAAKASMASTEELFSSSSEAADLGSFSSGGDLANSFIQELHNDEAAAVSTDPAVAAASKSEAAATTAAESFSALEGPGSAVATPITACAVAKKAEQATGCEASTRGFFRAVRQNLEKKEKKEAGDPAVGAGAIGGGEAVRKAKDGAAVGPYVIELNPLIGGEERRVETSDNNNKNAAAAAAGQTDAAAAKAHAAAAAVPSSPAAAQPAPALAFARDSYPSPASPTAKMTFPHAPLMAKWAEAEGVDYNVAVLYRDPVEAVARTVLDPEVAKKPTLGKVLDAMHRQAAGYREMTRQLARLSRDFYTCHSMNEAKRSLSSSSSSSSPSSSPSSSFTSSSSSSSIFSSAMKVAAASLGRDRAAVAAPLLAGGRGVSSTAAAAAERKAAAAAAVAASSMPHLSAAETTRNSVLQAAQAALSKAHSSAARRLLEAPQSKAEIMASALAVAESPSETPKEEMSEEAIASQVLKAYAKLDSMAGGKSKGKGAGGGGGGAGSPGGEDVKAFWTSAGGVANKKGRGSGSEASDKYLSVGMPDRVDLLQRVADGLQRTLTPEEVGQYVAMENNAYVAYFALRMGVCRRKS